MESLLDRLPERTLSCHLRLVSGSGQLAARESRQMMRPEDWALLAEFALAVVCLAESESASVVVVRPDQLAAALR